MAISVFVINVINAFGAFVNRYQFFVKRYRLDAFALFVIFIRLGEPEFRVGALGDFLIGTAARSQKE